MKRASCSIALGGMIACAIAGAVASIEPSMAFRSKSGVIQYTYGLSVVIAPALWALIAIAATRALRSPTPRRLVVVAIVMMAAMPLLLGIRMAREPWFDIDDQFVLLSPRAIHTYLACVAVATGIAIYLATMAHRIGVTPPAIPRAAAI